MNTDKMKRDYQDYQRSPYPEAKNMRFEQFAVEAARLKEVSRQLDGMSDKGLFDTPEYQRLDAQSDELCRRLGY